MVLLTVLLLAILFIAGLVNIFFYLPTNKLYPWLQTFFPNKFHVNCSTSSSSSSSSPSFKKEKNLYQKDELKKVFATFDKNGDGFITRQELRESLINIRIFMTDKEIEDIVVRFDSNGDGLIDFDEFCLLTSESMSGQVGDSERYDEKEGAITDKDHEEEDLKEAFDVFDKDKDGVITVEELALVLNSLGLSEGKKIEDCREMIKKVDMDGDGMVNFNEFKRMMTSGGKLLFSA